MRRRRTRIRDRGRDGAELEERDARAVRRRGDAANDAGRAEAVLSVGRRARGRAGDRVSIVRARRGVGDGADSRDGSERERDAARAKRAQATERRAGRRGRSVLSSSGGLDD